MSREIPWDTASPSWLCNCTSWLVPINLAVRALVEARLLGEDFQTPLVAVKTETIQRISTQINNTWYGLIWYKWHWMNMMNRLIWIWNSPALPCCDSWRGYSTSMMGSFRPFVWCAKQWRNGLILWISNPYSTSSEGNDYCTKQLPNSDKDSTVLNMPKILCCCIPSIRLCILFILLLCQSTACTSWKQGFAGFMQWQAFWCSMV